MMAVGHRPIMDQKLFAAMVHLIVYVVLFLVGTVFAYDSYISGIFL